MVHWIKNFGCSKEHKCNNLKSIYYDPDITNYNYENGSEILPYYGVSNNYDLIELEVYRIIIE